MEALVKFDKGPGNVVLMDVPEPRCGNTQVMLEVHCCGICGTDLHVYNDTFRNFPPVILGHEFAGTIVEVGAHVQGIDPNGSFAVLGATAVTCGLCQYCHNGQFMFCEKRRGMGHGVNGAFARYVAVRPDQLFKLPAKVTMQEGALVEPLAAAVHAVCDIARFKLGDVVLLSGPGPIGLLCLKLLAAQGLKTIVAGTADDNVRLDNAQRYGAARIVKIDQDDLEAVIAEETGGKGVDLAIECAGAAGSVRNCLQALRPLGHYVQVGHFGKDLSMPWDLVAFKQLTISGSVGYTRDTWHQTLRILEQGQLDVHEVVTHELPLADWRLGFDLSEQKKAVKVLLYPNLPKPMNRDA
ncbi:zinc-dependent alcohol dehydrogenase [Parapedobacter soli]|uniref:zinc-dependent alcohol dehydrogenase n=1 Tax=Parapedobacter soli TaxID=416955 RepID=UPI0021C6FDAC|nr:alcohol dehydrogenase catalytic domain-containing protein [Parapedobacter soli]